MDSDILELEIQVIFLKIGRIDVKKGCFEAEFIITTTWQEVDIEINDLNFNFKLVEQVWLPEISIKNVIGNLEEMSRFISLDNKRNSYLILEQKLCGKFEIELNLIYYPLDIQRLFIILQCKNGNERKILIVNNRQHMHSINKEFINHDYYLYEMLDGATLGDSDQFLKAYSVLKVTFFAARLPSFLTLKWIIYPFIIGLLSIFPLVTDTFFTADRIMMMTLLTISVIMIKSTLVKVKLSIVGLLESYWWILRTYLLIVTIWISLQSFQFLDKYNLSKYHFLFIILYFLFHLIYAGWIYNVPIRQQKKLSSLDFEYEMIQSKLERNTTNAPSISSKRRQSYVSNTLKLNKF